MSNTVIIILCAAGALALAAVAWAIISWRKTANTMKALNHLVDNAIDGTFEETIYDESQYSALEAKMSQYLQSSYLSQRNLSKERDKIKTLISDISHQTKTPITNIRLYAQLLTEKEGLSQEELALAERISDQAERLQFLISALVNLSRLETDIISVKPMKANVLELLEAVAAQGSSAAAKKGITLEVQCKADVTAMLDEKWTIEALWNMVDNAIKYTDPGGTVTLSAEAHEMFCTIKVRDNGMGIAEEEQCRIFSRFYRSPQVRKEAGVGIGLYLSRQIISAQNGFIKVYSKPGQGTVFSVSLPRDRRLIDLENDLDLKAR